MLKNLFDVFYQMFSKTNFTITRELNKDGVKNQQ